MNRLPFRLEPRNAKLLGVSSGIARSIHVDPLFVRLAWVAVPLLTFVTFWQALLIYLICGAVGGVAAKRRKGKSEFSRMGESPRASVRDLREKLDTNDRRMMAIDHHLNNGESAALAREIEALRGEKA